MTHLSVDQLRRWLDAPDEASRATIVSHLAICNECADRYAELVRSQPDGAESTTPRIDDFVARGLSLPLGRQPQAVDQPSRAAATDWAGRWALAAALILAVGLAAWQWAESRRLQERLADLQAQQEGRDQDRLRQAQADRMRVETLGRELQEERRARALLEQELSPQRDPSSSTRRPSAGPILSLFLTPGRTRAAGPSKTLAIESSAGDVRFLLALDDTRRFRSYDVEILNAEGRAVWTRAGVAGGGQAVIVSVPAERLTEDDYELVLRGAGAGGTKERAAGYYFTVLRHSP